MPPSRRALPATELRGYLNGLDRAQLLDLILAAAEQDAALARRLTRDAARIEPDIDALGETVRASFRCTGPLDHWPAIRYADSAASCADALAGLVRAGRGADAVPLLELAVGLLRDAIEQADDSAGELGDLMRRLLGLHVEACAAGPVDPARLVRWLLGQGSSVDIAEYATALGESGLATYRAAIDTRWRTGPADPGVRLAREGLARYDRDVPALIEIVGGDLRTAAQYGRLARALRDVGAHAAAIDWAERGLRAFPEDSPGAGLREFLVEAYLSRDGGTEAVQLRRERLAEQPSLHTFTALRAAARQAGRWDAERPAALAVLARRNPEDHVRALLAEDDVAGAWAAAQGVADAWAAARGVAGLSGHTWDELARRRARTHPGEAVDVMLRRVEEVLASTRRDLYRDAVRRLHLLREVCGRCGRTAEFEACVRTLVERHQRRATFLAELSRAGLSV